MNQNTQAESKYKLPKLLIGHNKELPAPVIISLYPPYIIGKVWRFKDWREFIEFKSNFKGYIAVVKGYQIAVTLGGTVTNNNLQIKPGTPTVQQVLNTMSDFYLEERIEDKKSFYKKFKMVTSHQ